MWQHKAAFQIGQKSWVNWRSQEGKALPSRRRGHAQRAGSICLQIVARPAGVLQICAPNPPRTERPWPFIDGVGLPV